MSRPLAVIVLNYRTPDLTLRCLESLAREVEDGIEVIVVDNASNDGSADTFEAAIAANSWTEWARVLRAPRNGGFAYGNNLGIKASDAEAYLLLNSDTQVLPGTLKEIRHALEVRPDAGLIGTSYEKDDGSDVNGAFRTIHPITELLRAASTGPLSKLLARHETEIHLDAAPKVVDWIAFAAVTIRRNVIDEIGLLDEAYFMYFEDLDYCLRAHARGWNTVYWPAARVVHSLGGSSQITAEHSDEVRRRRPPRYYYEARARYFAKHFGRHGLFLANVLWNAGWAVSLARAAVERKPLHHRRYEALDIWINATRPMAPYTQVGAKV
ncbi:MAG: glycosyltransferase family 2 protein [Deltaproteobacteria bacterium]|nr:glycosyltransferase family 2 protein [Deltaproteobacteria bacterium]